MVLSAGYRAVIDACVLIPPALCDLFLKLAETPRLYSPRWSEEILDEVHKNQVARLKFEGALADSWRAAVTEAFPEALVSDYHAHMEKCANHEKDRHVLAAAIRCEASDKVTFNLKDFPAVAPEEFGLRAVSPSAFLTSLYEMKPVIVASKIDDMAAQRKKTREEILRILFKSVPSFAARVAVELEIDLASNPRG